MDKYYVHGCAEVDGLTGRVVDEHAQFWTLYERDSEGLSQACADFTDRVSAEKVMAVYAERDTLLESSHRAALLTLLDKKYDGESIVDVARDVSEAFSESFTPAVAQIPTDEHGIQEGEFRVAVTWQPER